MKKILALAAFILPIAMTEAQAKDDRGGPHDTHLGETLDAELYSPARFA